MLKIGSLSARRGPRRILRDLSVALGAGETLLVTGANGSGKSSLLRLLATLLTPDGGAIFWDGENIAEDQAAHRRRLHYLGHADALKPELTPAGQIGRWRALDPLCDAAYPTMSALALFGLESLADRPIRLLSAGQKRRLALCRLGLRAAPLWLLDEPATALDAQGQTLLSGLVERHCADGGIAVIATHHELAPANARILQLRNP